MDGVEVNLVPEELKVSMSFPNLSMSRSLAHLLLCLCHLLSSSIWAFLLRTILQVVERPLRCSRMTLHLCHYYCDFCLSPKAQVVRVLRVVSFLALAEHLLWDPPNLVCLLRSVRIYRW